MAQHGIRSARFPPANIVDYFDILLIPWVDRQLVIQPAQREPIACRERVIDTATVTPTRPMSHCD